MRSAPCRALVCAALALAPVACARSRRSGAPEAPKSVPQAFAVLHSTAAPSLVVTPYSAEFYVDFNLVLGRYLQALLEDAELKDAYEGYYRRQGRTFEQLWSGVKRQLDRLGQIAMLYPGAAAAGGVYRAVRSSVGQGESVLKRELSQEEKVAADVQRDIRLSIAKVAGEGRIQRVYDSSGTGLLYLDPAWDLTERVYETLLKAKKAELASKRAPEEGPGTPGAAAEPERAPR